MANKYSSHLYELINSLSKAEKRYFKVYVSRHTAADSQNNAQILFDAINKQTIYEEEQLLEQLSEHVFIKKFSIAKARLYDTILKSLDAFYSEKSKEQIIRNELHFIEILFEKSLYKQSLKRLKSAKKQAQKYNKTHLLLELLQWEKKLIEKDNYQSTSSKSLTDLSSDENELIASLSLNSQLWEIKSLLFHKLNKVGRARTEEEIQFLKKDLEPVITKIKIPKSKIGLSYLFNHLKGAYYFGIQDNKNSLETVLQTIDMLEENPNHFGDEPNILVSTLTNGVYLSIKNEDIQVAQQLYAKLKILFEINKESGSKDLKIKMKSSLWSIQLLLIKLTCDFSAFDKLESNITQFLETNENKINNSRLAFFYYNLSHILFIQDKFSESLKWTNKLLNNIAIDQSQEIYSFAELLNLFLHFELGNYELVQYNLKSTKRFLKTRNKLFAYEEILLNFFSKTTHPSFSKFDLEVQFSLLITKLSKLNKKEIHQIPLEYFECTNWAESKLKNKKLSDIIKTQNKSLINFQL